MNLTRHPRTLFSNCIDSFMKKGFEVSCGSTAAPWSGHRSHVPLDLVARRQCWLTRLVNSMSGVWYVASDRERLSIHGSSNFAPCLRNPQNREYNGA